MRNRIFNINILVILLISVFLIVPKDVNASTVTRVDASQCYENMPSEYGIITCGTSELRARSGFRTYYGDFNWTICSNGDGTVKYSTNHNTNISQVQDDFIKKAYLFYDSLESNRGKCPESIIGKFDSGWFNTFNRNQFKIILDYRRDSGNNQDGLTNYEEADFVEDVYSLYNNSKPWLEGEVIIPDEDFEECQDLLGNPNDPNSFAWLLNKFLFYFKIGAPILVLIMSTIDFVKAIMLNDDDTMKKAQKKLITRIILAISLFLIPSLLELLFDIFGFTSSNCIK